MYKCTYLFMFEHRGQKWILEVILCHCPPVPLSQCSGVSRSHEVPAILLSQPPLEREATDVHKTPAYELGSGFCF